MANRATLMERWGIELNNTTEKHSAHQDEYIPVSKIAIHMFPLSPLSVLSNEGRFMWCFQVYHQQDETLKH